MNSVKRLLTFLILVIICYIPNIFAFDSNNYKDRELCNTFEVASFKSDGNIETIACFDNYGAAKSLMVEKATNDVAVMTKVNGKAKIIDANYALVDLTVNAEQLTNFYRNSELTGSAYTYMDNGTGYGAVDAALIDVGYSNTYQVFTARVRLANYTGWIRQSAYEIVPLTWVKSASYYNITKDDIRHNYIAKVQNVYSGSAGRTIGPKPAVIGEGKYYSYDGHYFYLDLETMLKDYKNGNYLNSVNKEPYYNYYMYLSNHTKTAYSSLNIDEYIRNNLGYKKNAYGNKASSGTSRLYGQGVFFYYAQEKYGVNAVLALSLSRNETGNGTSSLAVNKNNGFGLNAVDSNPIQAANWYASFSSSILGYASKWVTYGYTHPRDWRYFGPQFGDKLIGMNVKYASDAFWSEKMAANYYSFDKALGLQDYNYYQLGVVKGPTKAYSDAASSSRVIYEYPEAEDALVIVSEVTKGNEVWYKVVSDLNIDSNFNEIKSGNYNWNGYVYVKSSDVLKINQAKNGYASPSDVFEYEDKNYEYDLFIENTDLKPKVAISLKDTSYYYDSALLSKNGKTLLKDKYVMVYSAAYSNGKAKSYLVTSDYFYDQKEWVSADSIKFVDVNYGKVSLNVSGNQYTWVNYNTEDEKYSLISGLYTNTYVPVLEAIKVDDNLWYKVPVNLYGNDNSYGYTLAEAPGVKIEVSNTVTTNSKPEITAKDRKIYIGSEFKVLDGVSAYDNEDKDITSKLQVVENTVNSKAVGEYKVTYSVKDKEGQETVKTIKVEVIEDQKPVIDAKDVEIKQNEEFKPLINVKATDKEDGDLTKNIKVINNTVNTKEAGIYKVVYEVVDSFGNKTVKEIKVTVSKNVDNNQEDNSKIEREGEFYLENLKWNSNSRQFEISGYLIVLGQNNIDKDYSLIFKNKDTSKEYETPISKWKDNVPYDLGSDNGNSYTDSWFKGVINFKDIPNGDYDVYVLAKCKNGYSRVVLTNFFNKDISRRGVDSKHGYNFKVIQQSKYKNIELQIRDNLYTVSEAPTSRNMVNGYDEIDFKDNKLYIYGYSYDYNATYSDKEKVTRKIILEKHDDYKQILYDLTNVTGPFGLVTQDNKSKEYVWFENELDISNLVKGRYTLLVYSKTVDAENYDEIPDLFRALNSSVTISGKKYTITHNKNRNNRIELIVE